MRLSQDDSQPQFEQHPSFATSSFNSASDYRPHSAHDVHDDSGIDLGLIMDSGFDASKDLEQGGLSVDDRLAAAIAGPLA
jgi:hypothetical protein